MLLVLVQSYQNHSHSTNKNFVFSDENCHFSEPPNLETLVLNKCLIRCRTNLSYWIWIVQTLTFKGEFLCLDKVCLELRCPIAFKAFIDEKLIGARSFIHILGQLRRMKSIFLSIKTIQIIIIQLSSFVFHHMTVRLLANMLLNKQFIVDETFILRITFNYWVRVYSKKGGGQNESFSWMTSFVLIHHRATSDSIFVYFLMFERGFDTILW